MLHMELRGKFIFRAGRGDIFTFHLVLLPFAGFKTPPHMYVNYSFNMFECLSRKQIIHMCRQTDDCKKVSLDVCSNYLMVAPCLCFFSATLFSIDLLTLLRYCFAA